MNRMFSAWRSLALLALAAGVMAMLGCGGAGDDPTATSPATGQTATAQPTQPGQQPTQPPTGGGPSGELVIAITQVQAPIGTPRFCTAGCAEQVYVTSVMETLFRPHVGDILGEMEEMPVLATGWELASDLTYLDFDIASGVPFHGDWGEMTAEDVAFSFNDANSNTTPESIHGQAGDFAPLIKELEVIGPNKIRMWYLNYDSRGIRHRFSAFWQTAGVTSKAAFDQLGPDGMRDVMIGTGPYEVERWVENDEIVLRAVDDHWRKTPSVAKITFRQISEASTRRSALLTGEVGIALPSLKDWKDLEAQGMIRSEGSGNTVQRNIGLTGNWWETNRYYDDMPLERTHDDKPWVSQGPDQDPEGYEKARLVRQALAHSVDREGIVDSIMDGFGGPIWFAYSPPPDAPFFKQGTYIDKTRGGGGGWEYPYDPNLAKEFLEESGHGSGFRMENIHVGPAGTVSEIVTAVASGWKQVLNVDVTLNMAVYSTYRPGLVNRTTSEPFMGCGDDSNLSFPFDWARGFVMSSWSDGGYGVGMEIPYAADNYSKVALETDKQRRIEMNAEFVDKAMEDALCVGIVLDPLTPMYNPNVIASWDHFPQAEGTSNTINNPESIVLK